MLKELFKENMERLEILKTGISPDNKEVDKELLIENFMSSTYEIGIEKEKANENREFSEYITKTQALVSEMEHRIHFYIKNIDRMMNHTFYANEWREICMKRSAVEFLKEFYINAHLDREYIQYLDDRILETGEREGKLPKSDIPDTIPDAHWWWFV